MEGKRSKGRLGGKIGPKAAKAPREGRESGTLGPGFWAREDGGGLLLAN
jgi:hypothetical protein